MSEATELWLRQIGDCPDPTNRLICFPHAGGSASFFRDWGGHLTNIQVFAVRYPGRAERIAEPPPTDLAQLGDDIAGVLAELAQVPLTLLGHSMGAVVALEAARGLQRRGVCPAHLVASGSRNAPLPPPEDHTDDDEDVPRQLAALGGTNGEMLDDPFFQELVLPYIRSDSQMFHAYGNSREPLLHCPVTTIVGDVDEHADRRPWPELTDAGFREHVVSGDHFYLVAEPPYALLMDTLAGHR